MKEPILHVIADLGVGGAQAALYHLWPSLQRSEKYAFELCVLNSPGQFGEQLVSEGATVHCLGTKRKYEPGVILGLRRLIKRGSYKIVHAHLFPELAVVHAAAAGIPSVRLVFTEHSANNRRRKLGAPAKLLDKVLYNSYARVISVSSAAQGSLNRWLPGLSRRSVMIPNSVRSGGDACELRLHPEPGIHSDDSMTLILFAGRLSHAKGADVLLVALSRVGRADYRCLIAGDGPERNQLESLTALLGLRDRVCFLGARQDVADLLSQANFLVLPSRWEGLPLIVLEAMAAGCPIIATSVDGTAEVLRNEESGLLVPPNDPIALAEAIERFLNAPSLRTRLAARAAIEVEKYLAENVAVQLFALYDEVLEESRPSRSPNGNDPKPNARTATGNQRVQ
jgi:glycosyltransferase involved in cell wall biosynthesis